MQLILFDFVNRVQQCWCFFQVHELDISDHNTPYQILSIFLHTQLTCYYYSRLHAFLYCINHHTMLFPLCSNGLILGIANYVENKRRGIGQCPIIFRAPYFSVKKQGTFATNVETWVKIWNHVWNHHRGCRSRISFKLRMNTNHFKLVLKRHDSRRGELHYRAF